MSGHVEDIRARGHKCYVLNIGPTKTHTPRIEIFIAKASRQLGNPAACLLRDRFLDEAENVPGSPSVSEKRKG